MPNNDNLSLFYRQIEGEITGLARPEVGPASANFRENAFTELVAGELEESGVLEDPQVYDFEGGTGSGSMKVNGYGFPEEDSRLDVFVTLYHGPDEQPGTLNASDAETAFNRLGRFVSNAFKDLKQHLEPGLDQFRMVDRIHGLKDKVDRLNLLLFTNSQLVARTEKRRKEQVAGLPATYEIWDLERLRRLRESGTSYEALNVDFTYQPGGGLLAVPLDTGQDGFRTWVTVFPGSLISELYGEYGSRLLELNVRSYLQARGKVNKGILDTLRDCPADFMAYNNGITVVAEKVVTAHNNRAHVITHLEGMQIVNGGQTTASIHRAAREFGADLSRVFVQGKITVVEPARFDEVVPRISEYSNTQNKVSTSDLRANHAFHVGMERVSRREWSPDQKSQWFYERARGSYQTARSREGTTPARMRKFDERYPVAQRFTKEDLAKFENTWRGEPYWVSRGAQKNFVHFMERIPKLAEGWEPTTDEFRDYVAKGILFREVQGIVRSIDSITAYRINVTAYTASLVADKTARRIDLERIWKEQKLSEALRKMIEEWAPVIFKKLPIPAQQAGKHVEESFKTQQCWDYIRALDLRVPASVQRQLVPGAGRIAETGGDSSPGETLSEEDQNNIALCMELTEAQWLKIASWGQSSGELKEWQRGVARTLAGYAAENWVRSPSVKQAKFGAEMIEKARAAGIFAAV